MATRLISNADYSPHNHLISENPVQSPQEPSSGKLSAAPENPSLDSKIQAVASRVLPMPEKILRHSACYFRLLLTAITVIEIVLMSIVTAPIGFGITATKSLLHRLDGEYEKSKTIWSKWANGSVNLVKESTKKSFQGCFDILKPETSVLNWTCDLLNLTLDCNGEARNALSAANACGSISSAQLGVVLGPLRILQGLLVCTVSVIKLIQMINNLKSEKNEIIKNEYKLNIAAYSTYIVVGLLWIALGSLMIVSAVCFGASPPLWLAAAIGAITFVLFDIGFFGMSAFYFAQARFAINNYINPFQDFINKYDTAIDLFSQLSQLIKDRKHDQALAVLNQIQKIYNSQFNESNERKKHLSELETKRAALEKEIGESESMANSSRPGLAQLSNFEIEYHRNLIPEKQKILAEINQEIAGLSRSAVNDAYYTQLENDLEQLGSALQIPSGSGGAQSTPSEIASIKLPQCITQPDSIQVPTQISRELDDIAKKKTFTETLYGKLAANNWNLNKALVQKMKEELQQKSTNQKYANIGMNAATQGSITAGGTMFDVMAFFNFMAPPDSPFNDIIQAIAWILQNTLCKFGDDPGVAEGTTSSKSTRNALKSLTISMLLLLVSAVLAGFIIGFPTLFGRDSLIQIGS